MAAPRQGESSETGRVNQKRRTRNAIAEAARDLLGQGITPTVTQAAELALVSRTTAYRYFPTQESLLMEVALNIDVDELERLVATPLGAETPQDRTLDILDGLNEHVFAAEAQYRTALRLYLDVWLDAAATGDDAPVVREGRRRRWYETSLEPLRSSVDADEWDHLITALCVLGGPEAMTVLCDVCRLDADRGRAATRWAAATLLRATFGDQSS
jgi:AcrR family transcriptional regulator